MGKADSKLRQLTMDMKVGETPFVEYPRPQFVRKGKWMSLNGKWDCGVNVPFPLQSTLSGFEGEVPDKYAYYTTFEYDLPEDKRLILHFGAVDQICKVYVNEEEVGEHEGGYLPFSIDISNQVRGKIRHLLHVDITDELSIKYPYGKQTKNRGGMWYTPVSGIWQTVWLEEVPLQYIQEIKITPSLHNIDIGIIGGSDTYNIEISEASIWPKDQVKPEWYKGTEVKSSCRIHDVATINIENPLCWDPDHPFLYTMRISTETDEVITYFALRTVSIRRAGWHNRICLNDKPFFLHAVLDQGYYPEGIFLPNNERGYDQDILMMKELGFNTLRKHIKIEPPMFYVACDRIGMVVMQDMVNNSDYSFWRDTIFPTLGFKNFAEYRLRHPKEHREFFEKHMIDTVKYLYNFSCICYYTIFNEGWGQFDSERLYEELKLLDNTRVVDATSGWFRQFKSDVFSDHCYFHPVFKTLHRRPIVISEFGGYSYIEKNHTFNTAGNYSYKNYSDKEELSEGIRKLYMRDVVKYIKLGCNGSVYTQLCDVEDETNGCYTYDRKVCKVNRDTMNEIARAIYDTFDKSTRDKTISIRKGK